MGKIIINEKNKLSQKKNKLHPYGQNSGGAKLPFGKEINLNIPLIIGVIVVLVAGSLVAFGVYHSRRDTTGYYFEVAHAPIPTIDIYEDPLCPYCGLFEQSQGGKFISTKQDSGNAVVEYHLTNILDNFSASKNYSSRVLASLLAIEKSTLSGPDRKQLWRDYHESIFQASFQPKENATSDHSDAELAQRITTIAHQDKITLPDSLTKAVQSAKYLTEAKAEAKANFQELQSEHTSSVPAVFGNGKLYPFIIEPAKTSHYQPQKDISRPEFFTMLTTEVKNFSAPSIEVFEDPLCPMCGFYERTSGAKILRKQALAGRIRVQYRLINYLDQESASKDYSTRADSALYAVEKSHLHSEDKLKLWTDFHSELFSSGIQPEEQSSADLSNKKLADILISVANRDNIVIPQDLTAQIETGHFIAEVKKKARGNLFVMQSHSINGTPTLWGKGKQYGLKIDSTGKTAANANPSEDVSNPAFVWAYIYGKTTTNTTTVNKSLKTSTTTSKNIPGKTTTSPTPTTHK